MASLTINVDTVAAVRSLRGYAEPDPVQVAVLVEMAGADGVAIQLSPRRQFVRDRDLYLLKGVVKTRLTIEMPAVEEYIEKALEVKPWMVTLVSSEVGGDDAVLPLDLLNADVDLKDIVDRLSAVGVMVGVFVDPLADRIKQAAKLGVSTVLLNCAGYSNARTIDDAQQELDNIDAAVEVAAKAGLTINCGRGLTYRNLSPLIEMNVIDEFVIGYSVAARAMLVGYERAVTEMLRLVGKEAPIE